MFDRSAGLPLIDQSVRQVVMRIRKVRLQGDRALVGRDRLVEPALRAQCGAEVAVGRGVLRAQSDRAAIMRGGFVQTSFRLQRRSEVAFRHGSHPGSGQRHRPVREHSDGGDWGQGLPAKRTAAGRQGLRHTCRREQHEKGHKRVTVSREDVEHHDTGRIGDDQRVEQPDERSVRRARWRKRRDQSEDRQRHEDAEVTDRTQQPQRHRPLGVCLLAFGVDHLRGVHEQRRFPGHQSHPAGRLREDVVDCAIGPVARHF